MATAKSTNGKDERKAIRAELEALYRANVPDPGDDRDEGLRIAAELQRAIEECVHSLRANQKPEGALDRLRRMRHALHEVRSDKGLECKQIVHGLHAFHLFLKRAKRHRYDDEVLAVVQKHHGELLVGWSDEQITSVLRAPDFLDAMTAGLREHGWLGEHGRPMGRENVRRLLKKR